MNQRHQDWFTWLWQEIERHDDQQARVLSLFDFLEQWLPRCQFRGCAFLNIAAEFPSPDHPIRRLVSDHKAGVRACIRQLISDLGIANTAEDLASKTDLIYLLFEGAISESQVYSSTHFIQVARQSALRLIQ
ncbi:hypothetical protein IQ250_13830 [Pseudanabaenaceae cyanobacterium LEGE 13415]|nr:hypothetical protein [Pseudanabaenaceae cyanobacterium LEGE 13415]